MESILENNKTIILERPKHNNVTFIYFQNEKINNSFDQDTSDVLDKLSKESDLVFIFNEKMSGEVNFEKMSSLYAACGYIECDNNYLTQSLYYATSYFHVLYERCLGFLMIPFEKLKNLDVEKICRIVNNGNIVSSIFKTRRLNIEELKQIFIKPEKQSFWDSIVKGKIKLDYSSGCYSRFSTSHENNCIFLRTVFVIEMRKFIESEDCPFEYLESFYTREPSEFFASIRERLPENVKVLDLEIEKIDLK
jgi:hypothetical protein